MDDRTLFLVALGHYYPTHKEIQSIASELQNLRQPTVFLTVDRTKQVAELRIGGVNGLLPTDK